MNNLKNRMLENNNSTFNDPDCFCTFDLGICASLLSSGFELHSLSKDNPKKILFIFKNKKAIEDAVNKFFADKLMVNARSLVNNIKALKCRIYSNL